MSKTIVSAKINILDLLVETIEFKPGLNIISGENGTLKTRMLQQMKTEHERLLFSEKDPAVRMQAISPKRNAESRAFRTIYDSFRQENKKLATLINERNINDRTFDTYPSLGELFYVVYDDLCKDGGDQRRKMVETTTRFNGVIRKLFSTYKLASNWDVEAGQPNIVLVKNGNKEVPLESLSLGEQEMLSLVVNLFASKETYDIFLIDEPEVHLNWHLEEKLFNYLDAFCTEHKKQIITVTHSRAIFKQKFLKKSQFLSWGRDGKIHCGRNLTPVQRRKLAGEAIEIIKMGDFEKPTFFVEDGRQESIISSIASRLAIEISITECGNSSNVKSLFLYAKRLSGWNNSYFIIDGDNEGNPFPKEKTFIHLEKYCIENYLLDVDVVATMSGKSILYVKELILQAIKENRNKILKKNKFLDFLVDGIKIEHITGAWLAKLDASEIIELVAKKLGLSFSDYLEEYCKTSFELGNLTSVFPKRVVEAIETGRPQV